VRRIDDINQVSSIGTFTPLDAARTTTANVAALAERLTRSAYMGQDSWTVVALVSEKVFEGKTADQAPA
jgi:hypothetical protein